MSNFYTNNNIENLLHYNNLSKNNNFNHICFGCIVIFIILFITYDFCTKKYNKLIKKEKKKTCTTCQGNKNIVKEEHNNLILKYETENFKEIFNKSD